GAGTALSVRGGRGPGVAVVGLPTTGLRTRGGSDPFNPQMTQIKTILFVSISFHLRHLRIVLRLASVGCGGFAA
ncbi:MAG: hypothetical protein K2X91_18225, partial [Thermoleophilia bacterium]|nr:hypothetical protein [Thermoleophilia bacterium]